MKKHFTLFFASALCALGSWAQSGTCGDSVAWKLDGDRLVISGKGKMSNYSDPHDMFAPWLEYKAQIKEITIEPGVTEIGDYTFNGCEALTSLSLPEGLLVIGQHAFYNCSSLPSVTFPESLTDIGRESSRYDPNEGYVFARCSKLKQITIPVNVQLIARYAFNDCDIERVNWNAENCTKPNYESYDHYYTLFYGNQFFEQIDFGATVKRVPCLLKENTFVKFTTKGSIELVAQDAFLGTQWLLEQDFGPVYIDKCLYTYKLPPTIDPFELDIRPGTVGITAYALYKDSRITRLSVPESLRYWDRYAIGECENLKEVEWNAIDCQMLNNSTPGIMVHSPMSPFIPGLEKITFGPKVEVLYEGFLKRCSEIKHLELPASLRKIGHEAFVEMKSLRELVLPDAVEEIADYMCYNCDSLETVTFGKGLKEIHGYYTLTGCPRLKTVNWNAVDCNVIGSMGNYVTSVTDVNFGDAVKRIPATGLSSATNVRIGKNVEELCESAFAGWAFENIDLPDGLKKIRYNSLSHLKIKELFIPASVDTLETSAFSICNNLEKVVIAVARPAEKLISHSSTKRGIDMYVPSVAAYRRIFGDVTLHPMAESTPASFTYDGREHELSVTNAMPGYEAEMPSIVKVSGAEVDAGEHIFWTPATFKGPRNFTTEVGLEYTVDKAQDSIYWKRKFTEKLHPGDRIDITDMAAALSGTQPRYAVIYVEYTGYPASHYATAEQGEDGRWYLNCLEPSVMRLNAYYDYEDFKQYENNWNFTWQQASQDFEIVKESGIEAVEAVSDEDVRVYTLSGTEIYSGPLSGAELVQGVYLVKEGSFTRKIVVK